jgi:hypothetical protein
MTIGTLIVLGLCAGALLAAWRWAIEHLRGGDEDD